MSNGKVVSTFPDIALADSRQSRQFRAKLAPDRQAVAY
jgi:hypothetical protein